MVTSVDPELVLHVLVHKPGYELTVIGDGHGYVQEVPAEPNLAEPDLSG